MAQCRSAARLLSILYAVEIQNKSGIRNNTPSIRLFQDEQFAAKIVPNSANLAFETLAETPHALH